MADLTGSQKAALMLLFMGEDAANNVFSSMEDAEIRQIAEAVKTLSKVSAEDLTSTLEEFGGMVQAPPEYVLGGEKMMRSLIQKALPPSRATGILADVTDEPTGDTLDFNRLPPKDVYSLIRTEHPQTQAAIMTLLGPIRAAEVLAQFPPKQKAEVLLRLGKMRRVPRRRLEELREVIADRAKRLRLEFTIPVGGERALATMLNRLPDEDADYMLSLLEEKDPELSTDVRKMMFVFDDLNNCDDRGIQSLLKEVPREALSIALASASPVVREKILKNMSSGAAAALKEDIEAAGAVRPADAAEAQESILEIARRLEKEGKLLRQKEL